MKLSSRQREFSTSNSPVQFVSDLEWCKNALTSYIIITESSEP